MKCSTCKGDVFDGVCYCFPRKPTTPGSNDKGRPLYSRLPVQPARQPKVRAEVVAALRAAHTVSVAAAILLHHLDSAGLIFPDEKELADAVVAAIEEFNKAVGELA